MAYREPPRRLSSLQNGNISSNGLYHYEEQRVYPHQTENPQFTHNFKHQQHKPSREHSKQSSINKIIDPRSHNFHHTPVVFNRSAPTRRSFNSVKNLTKQMTISPDINDLNYSYNYSNNNNIAIDNRPNFSKSNTNVNMSRKFGFSNITNVQNLHSNFQNFNMNGKQYYSQYRVPITSIEGHLKDLEESSHCLSVSTIAETRIFKSISDSNKRLDNYFNKQPEYADYLVNQSAKLNKIQTDLRYQIQHSFSDVLHKKIPTHEEYVMERKKHQDILKKLEKQFKEKTRDLDKTKSSKIREEIRHDLRNKQSQIIEIKNLLSEPAPRFENRNELFGIVVNSILYPASYDFLIRQISYSDDWSTFIDHHQKTLSKHDSGSNPSATFDRIKIPKIVKCDNREEFNNEINATIEQFYKLEIVDKPE